MEGALAALKAAAARRGANYVHLTGRFPPHDERLCFDQRFRMTGVAYAISDGYPPDETASDAGAVSNLLMPRQ